METEQGPKTAELPGGSRATISPTGSPFTYQNNTSQHQLVTISGGTVTTIEISRDGLVFDLLGLLAGPYVVRPGDRLRIAYLLAPTMTAYPL